MLNQLFTQLIRSFGVFFRTIRAFFTRRLTGIVSRLRRLTNFSRNATKVATSSIQSAVSVAQKPTKKEAYVETSRLLISKALILKIILVLIGLGLIIYYIVWPFILSTFLTAHFYVQDSRVAEWNGRVVVYADEKKEVPLYAGQLEDGVLQGRGEEYDENGLLSYEGWFVDGERSGTGTAYEDGVMVYAGQFAAGVYEGTGSAYEAGDLVYEGQFAAGVYEGQGKKYEEGVLVYAGSFQGGTASGDGTAYYPSGTVSYKGGFAAGLPEGTGTAYAENGQVLYRGAFAAGVYEGAGTLYLSPGETLEAEFSEGEPQGVVQWYRGGRLYYEGEWSGGAATGFGTLYDRAGQPLYTGQMKNGTLDGSWLLGLTAEELRAALGEGTTRSLADASGGFVIVSDQLGMAALCSLQTMEADAEVYTVYLFEPEEAWVRLLPGMTGVELPEWPQGTEVWSGEQSFTPPAGVGLQAGVYQSEMFTTETERAIVLSGSSGANVLLCWSRLESLPEGVSEPEEEGSDGRMQALLAALELMEVPEDAAEAAENPYYGTQAVTEALASCETLEGANELIDVLLGYWEQAEKQTALEENLERTAALLQEAQSAVSMGEGSADAVSALESQVSALEAEIQLCEGERMKAELSAQEIAGITPADYALGELLVSFDPAEQDVSQLAVLAAEYAQSGGQEVDAGALTNQVKAGLIDLTAAYTASQAALSAYESAASAVESAASAFAMGSGTREAWYEALSASADARAELCSALAAFTRQASELNQITGGWVSETFGWFGDVLPGLFEEAAEEAAAQAATEDALTGEEEGAPSGGEEETPAAEGAPLGEDAAGDGLEEAGKETLAQEDDPPDGPAGDAGGSQSDGAAAVQDAAAHELM